MATTVLCALSDVGLKVRVLVADGLQANMTMFSHLGVENVSGKGLQLPIRAHFP